MKHIIPFSTKYQTKQGVTSLYVVIFATILFGVITLSFVRIILSEALQSSNDDLSQSAYDSALAGVEDAKKELSACLKTNSYEDCRRDYIGGDCQNNQLIRKVTGDSSANEVKIQESSQGNGTDQAYTCVLISDKTPDYRATLSSDVRMKVIPLGISSDLSSVKKVRIQWFSTANGTNFENTNNEAITLPKKSEAPNPPIISVSLIQAGAQIKIDNDVNTTAYSNMVFIPTTATDKGIKKVTSDNLRNGSDATKKNEPYLVACSREEEFACKLDIETDFGGIHNAFLVISLPYGDKNTDFRVAMLKDDDDPIEMTGAQFSVDSTGRANQLYRRVESRIDPVDSQFPYPEYELQLNGGDDDNLEKNFWITQNCWTESKEQCDNNGSV